MFIETVTNEVARRLIAEGRQPYEFKTKNPAKGPIFGPGYDDPGELNRARRANRYAETLESAQECARMADTAIDGVTFLAGR